MTGVAFCYYRYGVIVRADLARAWPNGAHITEHPYGPVVIRDRTRTSAPVPKLSHPSAH